MALGATVSAESAVIIWSTASNVAVIDGSGRLTAKAAGMTVVTGKTGNGEFAHSITVRVTV